MIFSPLVNKLIKYLRILPGIGPKSAQRIALMLLEQKRKSGLALANTMIQALEKVGYCRICRILSETEICKSCSDPTRDNTILCIVESPINVFSIEQIGYRGRYFVLKGHLSPLDGIGPDIIGIPELKNFIQKITFNEIIIAINSTVEGEATAYYIAEILANTCPKISRIANGIPLGRELELIDCGTLARAFSDRKQIL